MRFHFSVEFLVRFRCLIRLSIAEQLAAPHSPTHLHTFMVPPLLVNLCSIWRDLRKSSKPLSASLLSSLLRFAPFQSESRSRIHLLFRVLLAQLDLRLLIQIRCDLFLHLHLLVVVVVVVTIKQAKSSMKLTI